MESTIASLVSAAEISDSQYRELSKNAKRDAEAKYSLQAFIKNIQALGVM
ncbi:hypothetical protein ACFQOZ_08725 [Comamonas endophytica]